MGFDCYGSLGHCLQVHLRAKDCPLSEKGASAFNSIDSVQSLEGRKPHSPCERHFSWGLILRENGGPASIANIFFVVAGLLLLIWKPSASPLQPSEKNVA